MLFKEILEKLEPLEDYEVEIILNSEEKYLIENKPGKQGSLRILQNHLGENQETNEKIDLTQFGEFFEEWKNDENTHPTIGFLDRFNKEGGVIKRIN